MEMGRVGTATRCGFGQAALLHERDVLEELLQDDLDQCGVPRARLEVEVHDLEILAVDPLEPTARCVTERFWRHRLDELGGARALEPGAFEHRRTFVLEAARPPRDEEDAAQAEDASAAESTDDAGGDAAGEDPRAEADGDEAAAAG
jgi:hypothetical protein